MNTFNFHSVHVYFSTSDIAFTRPEVVGLKALTSAPGPDWPASLPAPEL